MSGLNRREALKFLGASTAFYLLQNRRGLFEKGVANESVANAERKDSQEQLSPLNPIVVPTSSEIRNFLPADFNPQFVFLEANKKAADVPSFVVVGPITLNRILGELPKDATQEGEASVGQKYIEVKPDDPSELHHRAWVSFSAYKPDDLEPLVKFRNSHSPDTRFNIVFPVYPPDEWRRVAISIYQAQRGLNPKQAVEFDKGVLEAVGGALAGKDVDFYLTTFSTDYFKPL